jgi:putative NIF3 family GTP cyclohydrolase 1 type 2
MNRPVWNRKPFPWVFVFLVMTLGAASVSFSQTPLTARAVIERIQKNVGVPWQAETVDTFKAGDAGSVVTGIVVTTFPTFKVLQAAAASGKNLIICHEPVFYDHFDRAADLTKVGDAVLAQKKAFLEKNGLIVWRFHDHWHARRPDGILQGMVHALGWHKVQDASDPKLFHLPPTRLSELARELEARLAARVVRVVGQPDLSLSTVALLPGAEDSFEQMRALARPGVDAVVIGETREWETVEYARDAVDEGRPKALIILGHEPSEEEGMAECARWLRTFVTEVPVEFIPSGLAYWVVK